MQAVIIAAGEGSRLYPLTDVIPKIMVPVGVDQKPLAHMIVEHCMDHGIADFLFCLNEKNAKQVMNYLGDGSRFGCEINYSLSSEPLGTAGELKLAWEKDMIRLPSLIYYGDTLSKVNLTYLIQKHERTDADFTITVNDKLTIPYGYVTDDGYGKALTIMEKPLISDMTKNCIVDVRSRASAGGVLPIFYVDNEDFYEMYCRFGYDLVGQVLPFMMQNKYNITVYHDDRPFLDLGNWKNYTKAKEWI